MGERSTSTSAYCKSCMSLFIFEQVIFRLRVSFCVCHASRDVSFLCFCAASRFCQLDPSCSRSPLSPRAVLLALGLPCPATFVAIESGVEASTTHDLAAKRPLLAQHSAVAVPRARTHVVAVIARAAATAIATAIATAAGAATGTATAGAKRMAQNRDVHIPIRAPMAISSLSWQKSDSRCGRSAVTQKRI